ncbi:hypothetical protein [Pedobacter sp. L105]|nr:hypothetical protein [Pedobacter sp. L105]
MNRKNEHSLEFKVAIVKEVLRGNQFIANISSSQSKRVVFFSGWN